MDLVKSVAAAAGKSKKGNRVNAVPEVPNSDVKKAKAFGLEDEETPGQELVLLDNSASLILY